MILHNITNALVPCLMHIEDLDYTNNGIGAEQMLKCHGELAKIKEGFPHSLMQVVMNLFKNACEAVMALGDEVTLKKEINICIYHHQKKPCLEIRDSGIGITADKIDTIFKSGVSGKGSTGFGLHYCKTWLDANGGRISIESDGKNKGCLLRIVFNC